MQETICIKTVTEPILRFESAGNGSIYGLGQCAVIHMSDAYLAAYQKTVESRLTEGYRRHARASCMDRSYH